MQPTDSKTSIANSAPQNGVTQTNDSQKIAIPPSKKKSKPSSKTRRRLKDAEPIPFNIDGLSHDGRGVAIYGNGFGVDDGHAEDKHGKKIFVSFALPGESALVKITNSRASFEEGDAISIT
ncbi:MAG TPA: 23S rRNA (uracil(1939)-C(5))-methyltransferase, partial [Psychrobacter sp.]|nr:23S rRNA (uracil(1939)-C(5))-methyltransferase [Psychrobacter sp.]